MRASRVEATRAKVQQNPEVQKVHNQIAQLQTARNARAAQIADGLSAEFAQLQKREGELRSAIDAQKAEAARNSQKATEREVLKKEAQSAASLYDVHWLVARS